MIKTLDYDLLYAGPLFFLERYLRLFGLDMAMKDLESARVGSLAKDLLKLTVLDTVYVKYHAAVIAASALLLSINLNSSCNAIHFGLPSCLVHLRVKCF